MILSLLCVQVNHTSDIMNIEKQITLLTNTDNKIAYSALKELISISEKSNIVYPYFDSLYI